MAKNSLSFEQNPNMSVVVSYFTLMITSAIVFFLANLWFPQHIVLGTMNISMVWAILLSSGVVALIDTLALPFVTQWEQQRKKDATPAEMFTIFLVINFLIVWLITRVAEIFGMGVTSWLVVLSLAVALDLLQGMVMMWLENVKKS